MRALNGAELGMVEHLGAVAGDFATFGDADVALSR